MPFVISTEIRQTIPGGSPNPSGIAVPWYYLGKGKWTREMGRAERFSEQDAEQQLLQLRDVLPKQKFKFLVVDQLPLAAEAAALSLEDLERLTKLAAEFREFVAGGYQFMELPAPHEPRIYRAGERQCQCKLCVDRLLALFPEGP